ncbi:MAG: caspase family protein, partial [Chloroflexota bacterium]
MTATFAQGHALLIGVDSHQHHPHLDVPITTTDAEAVQAVLQNPDFCGYPLRQVTLLSSSQATKEGILQALDELGQLASDQTVFLFFAGHGALGTDGRYYLLTHDVKLTGNKVTVGTGLSEELLLEKLRAIPAKRCLMIFNACHSAHIGPSTLAGESTLPTLNPSGKTAHALLGTGEGRILIVASRKEQYSYFVPGAKTTFFTQKLVEGLEGEAAAYGGYIGVFSLYEYLYHEVKDAVQAKYEKVQEPVLTAVQTVGSFPVALYRGATTLGAFGEGTEGLADTAVEQITADKAARALRQTIRIDTGGGAYIGGSVHTGGGTFVGRDMTVGGDHIRGDKVGGD